MVYGIAMDGVFVSYGCDGDVARASFEPEHEPGDIGRAIIMGLALPEHGVAGGDLAALYHRPLDFPAGIVARCSPGCVEFAFRPGVAGFWLLDVGSWPSGRDVVVPAVVTG